MRPQDVLGLLTAVCGLIVVLMGNHLTGFAIIAVGGIPIFSGKEK